MNLLHAVRADAQNPEKHDGASPGPQVEVAFRRQGAGRSMAANRPQSTVPILCPGCNQLGAVMLEAGDGLYGPKPKPRLVQVAGSFRMESRGMQKGDPIIVCAECGTMQGA